MKKLYSSKRNLKYQWNSRSKFIRENTGHTKESILMLQ